MAAQTATESVAATAANQRSLRFRVAAAIRAASAAWSSCSGSGPGQPRVGAKVAQRLGRRRVAPRRSLTIILWMTRARSLGHAFQHLGDFRQAASAVACHIIQANCLLRPKVASVGSSDSNCEPPINS